MLKKVIDRHYKQRNQGSCVGLVQKKTKVNNLLQGCESCSFMAYHGHNPSIFSQILSIHFMTYFQDFKSKKMAESWNYPNLEGLMSA